MFCLSEWFIFQSRGPSQIFLNVHDYSIENFFQGDNWKYKDFVGEIFFTIQKGIQQEKSKILWFLNLEIPFHYSFYTRWKISWRSEGSEMGRYKIQNVGRKKLKQIRKVLFFLIFFNNKEIFLEISRLITIQSWLERFWFELFQSENLVEKILKRFFWEIFFIFKQKIFSLFFFQMRKKKKVEKTLKIFQEKMFKSWKSRKVSKIW